MGADSFSTSTSKDDIFGFLTSEVFEIAAGVVGAITLAGLAACATYYIKSYGCCMGEVDTQAKFVELDG